MGARSYVPKIGRFLQPDPVPGGTDNPYAYTDGNPVNETDLTGAFVEGAYLYAFNAEENVRSTEREAAREQAAREEAERKAAEAAAIATMDAKIVAEEATIPQWIREYAMGGPSLNEIDASEGIIPGGGMEGEGPKVIGEWGQPSGGGAMATTSCFKNSAYYGHKDECRDGGLYPYKVVNKKPAGEPDGRVNIGPSIGACMVGGVIGGTIAAFSSAGLATEAGAYAGCFVVGGVVTLFEVL